MITHIWIFHINTVNTIAPSYIEIIGRLKKARYSRIRDITEDVKNKKNDDNLQENVLVLSLKH